MPFLPPNQQRQSIEGTSTEGTKTQMQKKLGKKVYKNVKNDVKHV